jgi:hypothetical protein
MIERVGHREILTTGAREALVGGTWMNRFPRKAFIVP